MLDACHFLMKRLVGLGKVVVALLVEPRSDLEWVVEPQWIRGAEAHRSQDSDWGGCSVLALLWPNILVKQRHKMEPQTAAETPRSSQRTMVPSGISVRREADQRRTASSARDCTSGGMAGADWVG